MEHDYARAAQVRLIFALIIVAVFLDVIDFSVVTIALPSIQAQFSSSLANIQWIIGAYGITMAGFLLLSGRAGDIYGQKKLFIFGVMLFSITSLAGGLAPSLPVLIASRAIQGIGAAVSSVTAFAIFVALFQEGRERNKAMGIFVAVLSAGFAAGSLAGGLLTSLFGWRSVLFVNVPIGILTALLIQRFLPDERGVMENGRMDLPGALTVTGGLMLLVYALTVVSNGNFSLLQVIVPFGLSLLMLLGFLIIESRSEAPLVPLSFLRRGIILKANVLTLLIAAASGGIGVIMTVYMQRMLGYSALFTALGFLPPAIIFFVIGGWFSSSFTERLGVRGVLVLSTALIAAGLLALMSISMQLGYLGIVPGMVLWALGASIGFPALNIAAIAGTKHGEEGLASGLVTTSMRMGFPLGLAALLAVASAAGLASGTATVSTGTTEGFRYAFLAAATLSIVALAMAWTIRVEKPPRKMEGVGLEFEETAIA